MGVSRRAPRARSPGRLAEAPGPGCAGGAARRPGGMPGRKLPGKLEQLERTGASLLHNSRAAAAAAGRGGRSPAPAGPPTPAGARGGQRRDTWRRLRVTRETRVPDPRHRYLHRLRRARPSEARCSSRAYLDRGFGDWYRAGTAGSPGTLRPLGGCPSPARPLAAPRPHLRGERRPRSPRRRAAI